MLKGPYAKLKTNLQLSIQRLKLLEKKKTELALKARKEIGAFIVNNKVDRARIRVEHIIREDYMVEALEIVEMYCDLLLARLGLIEKSKTIEEGLAEPISSIIYVANQIQGCDEIKVVADILTKKYGKQYAEGAKINAFNTVSPKLISKLSVQSPPKVLVEKYLVEIANAQNIPFEPDEDVMKTEVGIEAIDQKNPLIDFGEELIPPLPTYSSQDKKLPIGFTFPSDPPAMPSAPNSGDLTELPSYASIMPPRPSSGPVIKSHSNKSKTNTSESEFPNLPDIKDLPELPDLPSLDDKRNDNVKDDIDFDDLAKRFDALKKKN